MIVAVTHMKLKHVGKIPAFFRLAEASRKAALTAEGNRYVSTKNEGLLIYRTLTVWTDEKALMNFVHGSAHMKAMKGTAKLSNEAYSHHWHTTFIPDWKTALEELEKMQGIRNPA